jgi:hypothetical protein
MTSKRKYKEEILPFKVWAGHLNHHLHCTINSSGGARIPKKKKDDMKKSSTDV